MVLYNYLFFQDIKSDNFRYRIIERAITKWGEIEKGPLLLYYRFDRLPKIILHLGGTNNILVDFICFRIFTLFRKLLILKIKRGKINSNIFFWSRQDFKHFQYYMKFQA